jgi:hypothetical protein
VLPTRTPKAEDAGLLAAVVDAERGGGASGGGRGGGGSAGGNGSGRKMSLRLLYPSGSSSWLSEALGTISERNSRSSEDNASELRGLEGPNELRLREKRLRKRETADGGGCRGCC